MNFHPLKTGDIITHDGVKHIVTGFTSDSGEIKVQAQPLNKRVKNIPYSEIEIINNSSPAVVRLMSGSTVQKAMQRGFELAKGKSKYKKLNRPPLRIEEVSKYVESELISEISSSQKSHISQDMLDSVMNNVGVMQGYLIGKARGSKKSIDDVAQWQDISRLAVKFANSFNRRMLKLPMTNTE